MTKNDRGHILLDFVSFYQKKNLIPLKQSRIMVTPNTIITYIKKFFFQVTVKPVVKYWIFEK